MWIIQSCLISIHLYNLTCHSSEVIFSIYAKFFLSMSRSPKPLYFLMSIELQGHNWWGLFPSLTSSGAGAFSFYPGLLNAKSTAAQAYMDKKIHEEHGEAICWEVLFFPRLHSAADWNQTVQTGVLWSHLVWRDEQFGGSSEGQVGGEWLKQEVICEGRDRWNVQVFSCRGLGGELWNLRLFYLEVARIQT